MPKLWIKSRFGSTPPGESLFKRLWDWFFSLDKYLRFALITILLVVIVTPAIINQRFSIFQHAANNKTVTINIAPYSGSYAVGDQFVVNLVIDGGGQTFNAAQASIAVSSNLTIQSLTVNTSSTNGCNFTFVNTKNTPTISDPSFAGAILNGSSSSCILYSMVVLVNAAGTGTIAITHGSVKAYTNSAEILLSTQDGSYNLGSTTTPTPTPIVNTPTPTPAPVVNTPTPTPVPATPTPTTQPVAPPTFDPQPTDTYQSVVLLTGTNTSGLTVYINNSTSGVTYPTSTSWQYSALLIQGTNTFSAYTQNNFGMKSNTVNLSINLHKLGDISGDNIVDLTDLSMFATDWGNTSSLNYSLSDMNADGLVDLTDFSILAKSYGN